MDIYHPEDHFVVYDSDNLIGFVGLIPDDEEVILNVFYIISPEFRGNGFLVKILDLLKEYCRTNFQNYKSLSTLTRKTNLPSLKGLIRSSFVRVGEYVEESQPNVKYEEYVFGL
jgi:RimJ/RimL family protein N-acetyltransferase